MILSTIQLVKNVKMSFTVRTVCRDIRLMFMLSHNPQTCHNCDKDFLSVDSLQIRMADVHDQCEKDAETEYDFNINVMNSFTVRTVCRGMWSLFMLSHTPRFAKIVTKNFSVRIVCRDMWPMVMKMGTPCLKIKPKLNINLVIVCLEKQ